MLQEQSIILGLLCNSVRRNDNIEMKTKSLNWSKLYSIACRNNIAPFLYDQVIKLSTQIQIDEEILTSWKQQTLNISLFEYRKNYAIRQILMKTKEENIEAVIFKGPVLANVYPNYALRSSCDTDILIKEEQSDKIFVIMEKLGYKRIMESEDNVFTFRNEEYNHNLELHTTLYGQHTGPRIDLLNHMNLAREDTLIHTKACGIEITTLGYEEQLIYLMFHLIKHFTLEGISLRHLIDVILYINAYVEKISSQQFWKAMEELGYVPCCRAFFSVGIRYLGLDSRIMCNHKLEDVKVCDDLLSDIMNRGLNEDESKQIFQLWGMMEPYMVGAASKRRTSRGNFLILLKPIDKKYEYARKHKVLLPICWIHKVCSYIHSKYILNKGIYTPLEKVKVAEGRVKLLQEVGLIEKG